MKNTSELVQVSITVQAIYIVTKKNSMPKKKIVQNRSKPYYTKLSVFNCNDEPLIERDFEG